MGIRLSKIISYILHPLLIPTYSLLLVFGINLYFASMLNLFAKSLLLIMIFSSTCIVPLIIFTIFKRKKVISSFHMPTKEERTFPYLVMSVIYFVMYMMLSQSALPSIYSFFLLCSTILGLVLLVLNLKIKISAHTAGIGGITGLLSGIAYRLDIDLTFPVLIVIALAGIVGYARLRLDAHKPSEIYFGFLAGITVFLLLTLFL